MVVPQDSLKSCRLCRRSLPTKAFYSTETGHLSSRCKNCHGIARRRCHVCRRIFIGKHGQKACSRLCHDLMRAPTFLLCQRCNTLLGPVSKLKQKYCSKRCGYAAATTGRLTVRKTLTKARKAQSTLRYHIVSGHITRPDVCEACGAGGGPIEGAHYNYDEPLRVRWLCQSCHRRWDHREPKGATVIVAGPGRRAKVSPQKTPAIEAGVREGEIA